MTTAIAHRPTWATSTSSSPGPTSDARREPVVAAVKPYDGHDAALSYAHWLAASQSRPLHAVAVLEPNEMVAVAAGVPVLAEQFRDEERAAIATLLEQRMASTAPLDTPQRVDVVCGSPAHEVIGAAREREAYAIVVGTGRHGPLGRLVYGERAVQIARLADRPVMIVPPDATPGPVPIAIVAVDFTPTSRRAALVAMDLVADGGRLLLVHVKSAVNLSEEGAGWWEEAYERRTEDLFRRFTAGLPSVRGITISTRMLHGDVGTMLAEFAHDSGAGVIACGGRRHSFIERMLLGSVSTELIRRAGCPVVVVPDRGYEALEAELPMVGGVVESWDSSAWPGLIERFGHRNGGRTAQLRFKTASPRGPGSVESGYRLVDASFDRAASRAEIVLSDPGSTSSQLSHRISNVRAVKVSTDALGRDTALTLDTVSGRCTVVVGNE